METCNTCGNPVAAPYRAYDWRGNITHGCVDASHDEHLQPLSESARWHNRPEAKALRRAVGKHIRDLMKK